MTQTGPSVRRGTKSATAKDNDCDAASPTKASAQNLWHRRMRAHGVRSARRVQPQTCTPGTPTAEICNGKDDNCNDDIDEQACSDGGADGGNDG